MDKNHKTIGRRYSRIEVIGGQKSRLETIGEDSHHLLRPHSLMAWAVAAMEARGVPAKTIIAQFAGEIWFNEGKPLRDHVVWIEGIERDDMRFLAARIYELCRHLQIAAASTTTEYVRLWYADHLPRMAFELGRLSMLAKVYLIDEPAVQKRAKSAATENRKFSEKNRNAWRDLAATDYPTHSARRAAELIAKREGRPDSEVESIRKAIGKKSGST